MALQMDIDKSYGDFHLKVRIDSMSKRIGILGASGCGKSMTLKSLAGIETPDRGRISVEGKVVYDSARKINWRPQKRKIGYLFQNYALFPNMSVETNIGAGLKKWGKEEKRRRVAEMIRKFRLEGLEKRLPGELSGGQQQRVQKYRENQAAGRSYAGNPGMGDGTDTGTGGAGRYDAHRLSGP